MQVGPSTIHLDPATKLKVEPPPISCSKCNEKFLPLKQEAQGLFHTHLLQCGGVKEQEGGKKGKRKRRGHGGGLKSTVRLLQKGEHTGNSRDGTDTGTHKVIQFIIVYSFFILEEATPKKRTPLMKKPVKEVPLVPTHNRTTRFKESKKKEARKIAARERRMKTKVERPLREIVNKKLNEKKKNEKTRGDKSDKKAVAEVLEKVISTVEKSGNRIHKRRNASRNLKDNDRGRRNHRERRLSVVRARQMNLYREPSSESEEISDESETEEEDLHKNNDEMPIEKEQENESFPQKESKRDNKQSAITESSLINQNISPLCYYF